MFVFLKNDCFGTSDIDIQKKIMLRQTVKEIVHFFGQTGGNDQNVTSAAFDSRNVEPGALFFAIQGDRKDGHDFLEDVSKKGGVAAVVLSTYQGPHFGLELIPVLDVIKALHLLAKEIHKKNSSTVIAVSGSVGKTTTKEFIETLLSEKYVVAKTPGNSNGQLGLPLWLINRKEGEEILVLEMGMSMPGEISRLVQIAPPDIGVLTNVELAHANNFKSLEMISQAKRELFEHPLTKIGFFQTKTLQFEGFRNLDCKKISYGEGGDYQLEHFGKQGVILEKGIKSSPFSLPFVERHLLENFLAALAVARHLNLSWDQIILGSKKLKTLPHRFEKVRKHGALFIDDSYNASPASVKAALFALAFLPKTNKVIAVLGEMKELGIFSTQSHLEVGQFALPRIDHLLCLGKECRPMVDVFQEKKPAELFIDLKGLEKRLKEIIKIGDLVLIKGSNSLKMWTLIDAFE